MQATSSQTAEESIGLAAMLRGLDATADSYATRFVDELLRTSCRVRATDLHLQPTAAGLDVRWRMDGVLQPIGSFPAGEKAHPVTRLKVLAELLTYRQDVPQEGRLRESVEGIEMRVSTFPTLHGERAVVRLFPSSEEPWLLRDLNLPAAVCAQWHQQLVETSGGLIVCGPAGAGKTTTACASLRQIVADSQGTRSIVSIEDPIEAEIRGVAQSQTNAAAGFTLNTGLRSLLRQDPEVIFVGEVRDPETAGVALQAALTGQLVITTFHATSAASAISRLADLGLEPYVLRSGVRGILHQQLVRRLCHCKCQQDGEDPCGWGLDASWQPVGCGACYGTGYRGRAVWTELLIPSQLDVKRELLSRSDADRIEALAVRNGMTTRWVQAREAVAQGVTSPAEARRVLGFGGGRLPP